MILANELRLGNYLEHIELGYIKVISISDKIGDYQSVFVENIKDNLDYNFDLDENIIPIPITETTLLKCGFDFSEKNKFNNFYDLADLPCLKRKLQFLWENNDKSVVIKIWGESTDGIEFF